MMVIRLIAFAITTTVLYGCASGAKDYLSGKTDYDRHRMSMIRESETQDGIYVFEAKTDGEYPKEDQAAEATRMEWLAAWMDIRGWCKAGYEVTERGAIGPKDLNFYDNDLRYLVKCSSPQ